MTDFEGVDVPDDTCALDGCARPRAIKPPTGPRSIYCSTSCRDKASYRRRKDARPRRARAPYGSLNALTIPPRPCELCGTIFQPKQNRSRGCSKYCIRRLSSAGKVCSAASCERPAAAKGLCKSHYNAQSVNAKTWSRGKPETRRANLRRKTQQRRARLKGDPNAALIDRESVGRRDGWRCGLCGRRVDRLLLYPHPRSASLDHIVPLSLGGRHQLANVQLAHLDCNVAKGNRGGGEQLLLIG